MKEDNLDATHRQVISFIENSTKPIFVTGRAGTGKTTFLHYIKSNISKNLVVIAPTAVAALNAGGVTIHSFFQLPLGPLEPLDFSDLKSIASKTKLSSEKRSLLNALELLIIDEISMVRSDTIDRIDQSLRMARGIALPFGGVQVLMFGDPYQLPPIFQNDWSVLARYYDNPYFFSAVVFNSYPMIAFELTKVYRQSDVDFLNILNKVRSGKIDDLTLVKLNQRCIVPSENLLKSYITLATHNNIVSEINEKRLNELPGEVYSIEAKIKGDFPKEAFPTDFELQLKVGARVIFIKNDTSGNNSFYNGRVASITTIKNNHIRVRFDDDHSELNIVPEIWTNQLYSANGETKEIQESRVGSFSQYPIKLSWAITIHKSQGLTLDHVILDIDSAFAFGQAYVALSRCRSLEGIILRAPVRKENIFNDPKIDDFLLKIALSIPERERVTELRREEQYINISELLNFSHLSLLWQRLFFNIEQEFTTPSEKLKKLLTEMDLVINTQIVTIGRQFKKNEFEVLDRSSSLIEHSLFLNRLHKASTYFLEKLNRTYSLAQILLNFSWSPANSNIFFRSYNDFILTCLSKISGFGVIFDETSINSTIRRMQEVMINYLPVQSFNIELEKTNSKISNPILFGALLDWRKRVALERSIAEYMIISEKLCQKIAAKLPDSIENLGAITGIGKEKANEFGQDILLIVRNFTGKGNLF